MLLHVILVIQEHFICVHGVENRNKDGCLCNIGWTSIPRSKSPFDPETETYYMCNVHMVDYLAHIYPQASVVAVSLKKNYTN